MKNIKKWLSIGGGIALAVAGISIATPLLVSCSNGSSGGTGGQGGLGSSGDEGSSGGGISSGSGGSSSSPSLSTLNQYCKYNPSSLIANIISKSQYDMMVNKTNDIAMDGKNLYTQYIEGTDKSGNWAKSWVYLNNQNINYVYVDNNIISFSTSWYETTKVENHGLDVENTPIYNNMITSSFYTFYAKEVTQTDGSPTLQWYWCFSQYPENESQTNLNLNQQIDLYKTYVNNSSNWHATNENNLKTEIITLLQTNKDRETVNNKTDSGTGNTGISWTRTVTWNPN